jgi:hypothetical protein
MIFENSFLQARHRKLYWGIGPSRIGGQSDSGGLPLLALAAKVRPRYRFKARRRDRLLADLTHSVGVLFDPSERFFDRSEKTTISSVQLNL